MSSGPRRAQSMGWQARKDLMGSGPEQVQTKLLGGIHSFAGLRSAGQPLGNASRQGIRVSGRNVEAVEQKHLLMQVPGQFHRR